MMATVANVLVLLVVGVGQCYGDRYIDLGYEVNEDSMYWPSGQPYTRKTQHKGYTDDGYWYELYSFCTPEHLGTHLDAPSHFAKDKWAVAEIPVEHLFGQGMVVDVRDKVQEDLNYELTADDLMKWMDEHGPLPDGAIVFVLTGWGSRYGNKTAYFGTSTNDTSNLIFPGIGLNAAQLLTRYEQASGSRVFGVGIDTASMDNGPSQQFHTHVELAEANIYGLENVANLEKLPPRGFEVIVMPIKLAKGSGAQARIIAKLQDDTSGVMASCLSPLNHYLLTLLMFTVLLRLF